MAKGVTGGKGLSLGTRAVSKPPVKFKSHTAPPTLSLHPPLLCSLAPSSLLSASASCAPCQPCEGSCEASSSEHLQQLFPVTNYKTSFSKDLKTLTPNSHHGGHQEEDADAEAGQGERHRQGGTGRDRQEGGGR